VYALPNINWMTKARRTRLVGHVACTRVCEEILLVGKAEGKTSWKAWS
jgi:hypothetical protein